MYVVTFYSFKGGVGRTMALANVGLQLAIEGRRVLLVDMDLEAPGLDTYAVLKSPRGSKGVVDFVSDYYRTGIAPSVADYAYELKRESITGSLIVMPAGAQDEGYAVRLNNIDWQELYSERDGFLLFEDLKAQWKQSFSPDYVLIDSRTGHTDVSGICTRQLPDTVVALFFPNAQNLRGLEAVVSSIRSDASRGASPARLHLVASNVPDLDDEGDILFDRLKEFREALTYDELSAVIHHYDSLPLIEQTVFTLDRPKSKLAREYKQLTDRIIAGNCADRSGAIVTLEEMRNGRFERVRRNPRRIDEFFKEIESRYAGDGEVLYKLAMANDVLGRAGAAERLIAEAQTFGYETEATLVSRARDAYREGDTTKARGFLSEALKKPRERLFSREWVVQVVAKNDMPYLSEFVRQLIEQGIDPADGLGIAAHLMSNLVEVAAAEELLRNGMERVELTERGLSSAFTNQLSLCLIAQGGFNQARALLAPSRDLLSDADLPALFNYSMAEWGETGTVPKDLFVRIVNRHSLEAAESTEPSQLQCIAIAFWAVGEYSDARELLGRAEKNFSKKARCFSAWRYLEVDSKEFIADLHAISNLIETGAGLPAVFARVQNMAS